MLNLSQVTLLGADCINVKDLEFAAAQCTREIEFGAVKLFSHMHSTNSNVLPIDRIKSAQEYAYFCIKRMADHFDTDFVLNIEWDGYILDPSKWTDEFLQFDYIGAPWEWYKDDYKVGNGGFSLRSKRLQQILKDDPLILETYPEDHYIGRTYRPYLEKKHNIKFAPIELARQFSQESAYVKDRKWKGSFGWHGHCVDFTEAKLSHIPKLRIKQ